MPNYRRPRVPGATIFATVCLEDRQSDLLIRQVDLLREAVRSAKALREFDIVAWVTLPDHFHCLLTLAPGDADYPGIIGSIKARFSKDIRRAGFTPPSPPDPRTGEVGLWQKRFYEHHVRDARDLQRLVSYCNLNPVRHGLVRDPFDWPHSSIHRDMQLSLRAGIAASNRLDPRSGGILGPAKAVQRHSPLGEPSHPKPDPSGLRFRNAEAARSRAHVSD